MPEPRPERGETFILTPPVGRQSDETASPENTPTQTLDNAMSYSDRLKIRAELTRLAREQGEQQDNDKGREPDEGRSR